MRRLTGLLRHVQRLNDETASEDFSTTRELLGSTHFYIAVFLNADEHDVFLYIEAEAACIHG